MKHEKFRPVVYREPTIIKSCQLKNYDPVKFCDLEKVNWDLILKQDSVHAMSSEFENCFVTILDKHVPLRQHKVRNMCAPYIDHELRRKMFLRDFYTKQFNKTKNPDTWKQFQQLRNKINIERLKRRMSFSLEN